MATNNTITTNSTTVFAAALEAAGILVAPAKSLREELAAIAAEVRQQNATLEAANRVVAAEVKLLSKEELAKAAEKLDVATAAQSRAYMDVMSASDAVKTAREEILKDLNEARRVGNKEGAAKLQKLVAAPAAELIAAQERLTKANVAERTALLALCAAQRAAGKIAPDPEKWVEDATALVEEADAVKGWNELNVLDVKLAAIRFAPAKAGGEARRQAKGAYFEAKNRLVAQKEAARREWEARRNGNGTSSRTAPQLSEAELAAKQAKDKADRDRHTANQAAKAALNRQLAGKGNAPKGGKKGK